MRALGRSEGWLGPPPGASFDPCDSLNPFLRYRKLLWSYYLASKKGLPDEEFVSLTDALDERVCELEGRGFRVTPTLRPGRLSEELGVELWVKDETCNVTGTHKARHLMGQALHLEVEGVSRRRPLAISSCGNAALAAAVVARAADRRLNVFVPTWADPLVLERLAGLDANVEVCPRRKGFSGDPCYARFSEAVSAGAWPFCAVAAENVMAIDGGRTLAFELIEALDASSGLDAVFVQVGGGALASSLMQGFAEAAAAGVIDRPPSLFAVQTEGCAPLSAAWERFESLAESESPHAALERAVAEPEEFMRPWECSVDAPASAASGILDDVTYDWLPLVWAMAAYGGRPVVVPESVILEANDLARRLTDVPVDHTGTAGLAGLCFALSERLLPDGARVGVLFTGVDRARGAGSLPPLG